MPTVLIHANWQLDPRDGTLLGAMNDDDAALAASLIKGVDFQRLHALHAVHFAKPHLFNTVLIQHAKRHETGYVWTVPSLVEGGLFRGFLKSVGAEDGINKEGVYRGVQGVRGRVRAQ
ncbi:MAG: hypothetical protein IPL43_04330 [Micropruina sp.]|nr:hypothetical protein [Micropruina sp.]